MRHFLSILFIGFLAIGCNNAPEEDSINTEFTPVTTTLDTTQIIADSLSPVNALQPAAAPVTTPAAASPRLNPPHGQPGHRCEIAVGAPLPANGASVPLNPAPLPNAGAPVINNNTGKNLNPPHGQPGHRCDIPVGEPLSSAPAAAPATTSPVVPTSLQTTPAPVTPVGSILSTTPATATAPGMNPPHGQPGHRCDIDVGAPLPKN